MSAKAVTEPRRTPRASQKTNRAAGTAGGTGKRNLEQEVAASVASLKRLATKATLDGMARYAIPSENAFGVPMAKIQGVAKQLGRDHELAEALWATGWYEARILAAFVDEPERVTAAQMDRWCREFGNWAVCDTVCFHLFDRTPHAFRKVEQWAGRRDEFVKRGAFALLACLGLHNKQADDEWFAGCLPLVERAADDERNFVKKGVNWALRVIGGRSPELNQAAIAVAQRLAASPDAAPRWVGRDALRELTSAKMAQRFEARLRKAAK